MARASLQDWFDVNSLFVRYTTALDACVMTVNEITPENKKLFIDATKPGYAQVEPTMGKDFLQLAIKELN
jgi:hypothetical protein